MLFANFRIQIPTPILVFLLILLACNKYKRVHALCKLQNTDSYALFGFLFNPSGMQQIQTCACTLQSSLHQTVRKCTAH